MPKMKVPSVALSEKQNGLKSVPKSFVEVFGDSSDDEKVLLGFPHPETWEEYRILAESCGANIQDKHVEVEPTSQRPKRSCRKRPLGGSGSDFISMSDGRSSPESSVSLSPRVIVRTSSRSSTSDVGGRGAAAADKSSECSWEMDIKHKSSSHKSKPQSDKGESNALRKRGVRCMNCSPCQRKEDCGTCEMCRDKKKFGGPGVKKQACIYRKCTSLIRNVPLKSKPKHFIPPDNDSYVSACKRPKRMSKSPPVECISSFEPTPLKPRKISSVHAKGAKDKETDTAPMVQIHWPDKTDLSGVPVYFIRTSSVSKPSVCLKCGSAGRMEMLRCVVCCSIFHSFCVDKEFQFSSTSFTCPSCLFCHICGKEAKVKSVQCGVCHKCYHRDCLSDHRSHTLHGMWKCVSCTRCIGCKTTTPGKEAGCLWYEDFSYCQECYNLKQKGNYCPLCSECYSDNDYDSKMVQCGKCDHWVHAQCEDMSDDSYEILSILPESVVFLCRTCASEEEIQRWQSAVKEYLEASMDKVAMCLVKVVKFCEKLGDLQKKIEMKDYPTIVNLNKEVLSLLAGVLKKYKSSSVIYRTTFAAQNDYIMLLDQLFPWLEEEKEREGAGRAGVSLTTSGGTAGACGTGMAKSSSSDKPVESMAMEWHTSLLHDHCYSEPVSQPHPPASQPLEAYPQSMKSDSTQEKGDKVQAKDTRKCMLCPSEGDAECNKAGRLLPCGVDEWVHVNCAIWSAEAYEEETGILRCVHTALSRGFRMRCEVCKEVGATVGCCTNTCASNYHFQCARTANCIFLTSKQVFCWVHRENAREVEETEVLPEADITVARSIFVDTNPHRTGRKIPKALDAAKAKIQIGSVQVDCLGSLVEFSETPELLIPDKFKARCEFWDVKNPSTLTTYTLTVAAPDMEDWLLAVPSSSDLPPTTDASQPDLQCPTVTVGELPVEPDIQSPWDSLKEGSSLPSKRRKDAPITTPIPRKPRIKNADLEMGSSVLFPQQSVTGMVDGNVVHTVKVDNREAGFVEHRAVAVQVLLSGPSTSSSSSSLASSISVLKNHSLFNHIITSSNPPVLNCTLNSTTIAVTTSVKPSHPNSSHCFPNSSAVKNFKIPKKLTPFKSKPAPKPHPAKPASRSPSVSPSCLPRGLVGTSSDKAVASSVCLVRKGHGLSTGPCDLCFTITNLTGRKWTSYDLKELWESILGELQAEKTRLGLPYAPHNRDAYHQFCLAHPLVVQLVEQLHHASRCATYSFSYHKPTEMSSWKAHRPVVNPTGSMRTEVFDRIRYPVDMFSFLRSDNRPTKPPLDFVSLETAIVCSEAKGGIKRQATSDLPMGMRYRTLQKMYKQHVGVFRSSVHGLGLFCIRDIEPVEMVIEYAGHIIRSSLTDPREKVFESKGIGCYMFRIDKDEVVDATMAGNEARFINHSCEPNCYSKIITVDNKKKIMIFALRRLVAGEELTYDYKFPLEDCAKKIPCQCGSRKCRKYLN